jgi:hypothetical protein
MFLSTGAKGSKPSSGVKGEAQVFLISETKGYQHIFLPNLRRWITKPTRQCENTSFTDTFLTKHTHTTFNNGYLGSHNDEERSEMRYVMRIA